MIQRPRPRAHGRWHHVRVTGWMHIVDDETWPLPDEAADAPIDGSVWVGPGTQFGSYLASGCAGDEVQGLFSMRVEDSLTNPGFVDVQVVAVLNEATSCPNGDQDGIQIRRYFLAPGQSVNIRLDVPNAAEGGDLITFFYTIKNNVI